MCRNNHQAINPSPNAALLHQINYFQAANLIDLQKGKKTSWVPRRCSAKRFSRKFCKIHRLQNAETPVLEPLSHNIVGLLINFIVKSFQHRCFPANFERFKHVLMTTSCVYLEKLFRKPFLQDTSGRLLISCASCRISASIYNNYFAGTSQIFCIRTRSSHQKVYI